MLYTFQRWRHHCTNLLLCLSQFKRTHYSIIFLVAFALASSLNFAKAQQKNPPRILLEGFWWDCRNSEYAKPGDGPNATGRWSNYLAELSVRFANLGIDAVWVPPNLKTTSPTDNGYIPFDHYDLGDKFQNKSTITKMGTKDELLRMVAVMHANGIDVVQDIVFNHMGSAWQLPGGIDPNAMTFNNMNNQRGKNLRYVCFKQPVVDDNNPADYLSRQGRFAKNWQNFHPNPDHLCSPVDQICTDDFGPDICYNMGAFGNSSNATYIPLEAPNYMYDNMSTWVKWYKKQLGFDGVRLDDVKQVEYQVIEGLVTDMQKNSDWASGGQQMFAVGEWVGTAAEMDGWITNQGNVSGTFDFSLRSEIYNMVNQKGFYPMKNIVNSQQTQRDRTVPFVNNHDTFRPILDAAGKYPPNLSTPWNQELGGHIDPRDPRMAAAYAIICAVDGSPQIFFEDLFDLNDGNRYHHNSGDLKWRDEIAKIIWAHQAMNWKAKDVNQNYLYPYKVRTSTLENPLPAYDDPINFNDSDILVIERESRAIIAINDNGATGGGVWVNSGFPAGTVLVDYSGQIPNTTTVQNDHRVHISVPQIYQDPNDPSKNLYGYAIWAPQGLYNQLNHFKPAQRTTTQEWEIADDLGDSHPNSLGQGGTLPISKDLRYVGKIYVEGGKDILIQATPEKNFCTNIQLWYEDGSDWAKSGGGNVDCASSPEPGNPPGEIDLKYSFKYTGWVYIYAQNTNGGVSQGMTVKATYTAPKVVWTLTEEPPKNQPINVNPAGNENNNLISVNSYPNPSSSQVAIQYSIAQNSYVGITIYSMMGEKIAVVEDSFLKEGNYEKKWDASRLPKGMYICKMKTDLGEKSVMIQLGD